MVQVPSWAVPLINRMSQATRIPFAVIACQANLESGFNTGAVSPAGAEGWLQFLPSTFASYASGSPFNASDAATAYIAFMNALLRWSGGNLRQALAAYNAGQGNWAVGLGYADEILSCAGGGYSTYVSPHGNPMVKSDIGSPGTESDDDWSHYISLTADNFQTFSDTAHLYKIAIEGI
jgi:hypothetical protein